MTDGQCSYCGRPLLAVKAHSCRPMRDHDRKIAEEREKAGKK